MGNAPRSESIWIAAGGGRWLRRELTRRTTTVPGRKTRTQSGLEVEKGLGLAVHRSPETGRKGATILVDERSLCANVGTDAERAQ
jgi:hypothetical protein